MIQSTSPGEAERQGRLLYRGAEADLVRGRWQGLDAVFKLRKPLPYRLPALDDAIRRQRTLHEAEMLHAAKKAGVLAPHLFFVDAAGATLIMEFVQGERLKDLVSVASRDVVVEQFVLLGRDTSRLHSSGIMHGDLTTANVISWHGRLVFLDFGLSIHSSRLEDHAVDLRLIKETLVGAHPRISSVALEGLLDGYSKEAGASRSRAVFKQLRSIERRGRYARLG